VMGNQRTGLFDSDEVQPKLQDGRDFYPAILVGFASDTRYVDLLFRERDFFPWCPTVLSRSCAGEQTDN
jgi:hypothetical protein